MEKSNVELILVVSVLVLAESIPELKRFCLKVSLVSSNF